MKFSYQELKTFLNTAPQDTVIFVYSMYYQGACEFYRLIFPTPVIPVYNQREGKIIFFKIGSHGQKLKTSIPFSGSQSFSSLKMFSEESECIEAFKKEYYSHNVRDDFNKYISDFDKILSEIENF